MYGTPRRLRALPSRLVNQVALAANRLTERALADTGLRRNHFAMLAALEEFGPSSQADLGRCVALDRSDVVAVVNALVDGGLVVRTPDPKDGRRNVVTITEAGMASLERLNGLVDGAQDELLRSLSATESRQFVRLLTRVVDDHQA